jgi:hypothetical protein
LALDLDPTPLVQITPPEYVTQPDPCSAAWHRCSSAASHRYRYLHALAMVCPARNVGSGGFTSHNELYMAWMQA